MTEPSQKQNPQHLQELPTTFEEEHKELQELKTTLRKFVHFTNSTRHPSEQNSPKSSQQISLLHLQLKSAQQQISQLHSLLQQQQNRAHKTIKEHQDRQKKQIQKYTDIIAEKQYKNQGLSALVNTQTMKINKMKVQLQQAMQKQHLYEKTVIKTIEGLKSTVKQLNTLIQQNQLDKVILQEKLAKTQNRIKQTYSQLHITEQQRKSLQEKYHRLKIKNIELREQNMELKFTIEEMKLRNEENQRQERKLNNLHNEARKENFMEKLDGLSTATENLKLMLSSSLQLSQKCSHVNELLKKLDQYKTQNEELKKQLETKDGKLLQLEIMMDGQKLNEILKSRKPSIFEELVAKKQEIVTYEEKVNQIHQFIKELNNKHENDRENEMEKKSMGIGSFNASQSSIQNEKNAQLQLEIRSLKTKIRDLMTKMEENSYERSKQQKLCKLYKTELLEMISMYEKNKGKKNGRTGTKIKKKLRCEVCLFEAQNNKSLKCEDCGDKLHYECRANHECKGFKDNASCCSSQPDY